MEKLSTALVKVVLAAQQEAYEQAAEHISAGKHGAMEMEDARFSAKHGYDRGRGFELLLQAADATPAPEEMPARLAQARDALVGIWNGEVKTPSEAIGAADQVVHTGAPTDPDQREVGQRLLGLHDRMIVAAYGQPGDYIPYDVPFKAQPALAALRLYSVGVNDPKPGDVDRALDDAAAELKAPSSAPVLRDISDPRASDAAAPQSPVIRSPEL